MADSPPSPKMLTYISVRSGAYPPGGEVGVSGETDSDDDSEFRAALQAWLADRYPLRDPDRDDDRVDIISRTPDGHAALVEQARNLQRALADAGFAALSLPADYGGQGLTRGHDAVVESELARFDTPSLRPLSIGLALALPTIRHAGTEAQRRRFLPPLVRGDELWCQMFSEPDAGSDLVSLRCRGVDHGDHWVVTGQKVWSSYAADAQYGLLLVRSDPDAARPHAGITMLLLDMSLPGVSVRPLVDIAGGHHFNEVFLEDVVVAADMVVGGIHDGWRVANGTLGGERSSYRGGSGGGRRRRQVVEAASRWDRRADPQVRQRLASVIADECILEWLGARLELGAVAGGNPASGSLMKLAAGNLEQKAAELLNDLHGIAAVAWTADDRDGDIPAHFLASSRQATVAGGTHEIQRNLLGERVLGLPRG